MKRIILFLAIIATLGCGTSGYVIKGVLEDVKEGTVYLTKLEKSGWVFLDSALVSNGVFEFTRVPLQEICTCYFQVKDSAAFRQLLVLEEGNIEIKGNVGKFEVTATGTPNNDALSEYMVANQPLNQQMKELLAEAKAVWLGGDTTKTHYYGEKFLALRAEYPKLREVFIKKYKDIELSLVFYSQIAAGSSITAVQVDSLIALIPSSLSGSPFFNDLKERAEALRVCDPGTMARDINFPAPDGKMVALSSLRGQYVLLDFWASWCSPCRAEIPHLKQAYEKYHEDGFQIYGVSLDNKREAWEKALADENMPWVQVSDLKGMKSPAAQQYSVSGIPATWLLDKNGKIIAKNLRGEELTAKLKEIFGH